MMNISSPELYDLLVKFARHLAAEEWWGSWTYEASAEDLIAQAKAESKAEIGKKLLDILGAKKIEEEEEY